jgi:XTP/dITP diphosphohydrolase
LKADELVLATKNDHKIDEIRQIMSGFPIEILTYSDLPIFPDVVEDGNSFDANALKKAWTVCAATGKMALADDSGLEVYYLGGLPGVRSARFAGEDADYDANNKKLLELMKHLRSEDQRVAAFRCAVAIVSPWGMEILVEGHCEGHIGHRERGTGGFGYDPLFIPRGYDKTFAEMPPEQKDRISHRGKAIRAAREELQKRFGW